MARNPIVLLHTDAPDAARAILHDRHPDLSVHTCADFASLPAMLAETRAEAVFTTRFLNDPYPRTALVEGTHVRWVSVGGSGTDHLQPWDPGRVTVTNSAGVAADMMAQYALAAMLHFSLRLDRFRARQEARRWEPENVEGIDGRTVLIVGMGQTGTAVAARCRAMGMRCVGVRANPRPDPALDQCGSVTDLPALAAEADFVVVCVPLLASTRGLIGPEVFAALKPSAVLIDVSRGGVVDEGALIAALDKGRIRGAALDVFTQEPLPPEYPLWGYGNVILTPHSSAVYDGWEARSIAMFCDNLDRYRRGEALTNVVDPARGY
jgi:phosphoglycerate dehydrogenase-like enzyme